MAFAGGHFPNSSPPSLLTESWSLNVNGESTFVAPITVSTIVESTTPTNGSIVVNGGIGVGGNVNAQGYMTANIFSSLSDERQKKDITIIDSGLDLIRDIDAVRYKFKYLNKKTKPDKKYHYGVIAQNLQEKGLGDLVVENKTNGSLSVDYNSLVGILIRSVQELEQKVKELTLKLEK